MIQKCQVGFHYLDILAILSKNTFNNIVEKHNNAFYGYVCIVILVKFDSFQKTLYLKMLQ